MPFYNKHVSFKSNIDKFEANEEALNGRIAAALENKPIILKILLPIGCLDSLGLACISLKVILNIVIRY